MELQGASEFRAEQWVKYPLKEVFNFFSDENNLEIITPPWLNFRVLKKNTRKIELGTEIDYRISVHGIPMRWRSLIADWQPESQFVDIQLKGPYALWHHTHLFEDKDGGTLMTDIVRYKVPMGWLGQVVAGWFVRRDIKKIFAYGQSQIGEIFK